LESDSDGGNFFNKLGRLFGGRNTDPVEQAIIEASQEGELEEEEGSMLLSVLHLDDIKVEDIMTPRTDIHGVDSTASVASAIEQILEYGHSRLPIYQDNRDNIVGIIYAKDLLREAVHQDNLHKPVSVVMRQPFFVPETKKAMELLKEFQARKTHMAIILDEYGGTSGLVTIEDVLEEIVGDIEDEHDAPKEADIVFLDDGDVRLSGRAYLEEVNEALNLKLDSDEVDTIGGLLSHIAGRLPLPGERFTLNGRLFIVEKADSRQVHSVFAPAPDSGENGPGGAP
jgi:magnesium and cobalt transporter